MKDHPQADRIERQSSFTLIYIQKSYSWCFVSNSRKFQHFIAAMEKRSLLGAAQSVNLSQPALSKSISVLEGEYGVKLFDRHPRGLVPTVFGEAMEFHARRILRDLEHSKRDMAALSSGSLGRLRIGSGLAFVSYAAKAMSLLEESYPNVDYTVITDYAERLRSSLIDNRIDLFVGMVNQLIGDDNFDTAILAEDRILGLCHRSHKFANRRVGIDDLMNHDWVVPEAGEVARMALESYFVSNQAAFPRFRIVTNIPQILGTNVRDNGMLSLSPESSADDFKPYELTWFRIKDFDYFRQIGIARRSDIAAPPIVEAYKNVLVELVTETFAGLQSRSVRPKKSEASPRHRGAH